jgi:hypothetical protein
MDMVGAADSAPHRDGRGFVRHLKMFTLFSFSQKDGRSAAGVADHTGDPSQDAVLPPDLMQAPQFPFGGWC